MSTVQAIITDAYKKLPLLEAISAVIASSIVE